MILQKNSIFFLGAPFQTKKLRGPKLFKFKTLRPIFNFKLFIVQVCRIHDIYCKYKKCYLSVKFFAIDWFGDPHCKKKRGDSRQFIPKSSPPNFF